MIDLSNKSVLIYDLSGLYTHIAEAIVPAFGSVKYASQWETGFSNVDDFLPGYGLEGIERVKDPFEHIEKVDLVIFPDVGMGGLQEYLRRQGIPVWGSGAAGKLERDRVFLKEKLTELGMDVADYEVITGLTALREYLKKRDDVWIKISYFRGLSETFHHEDDFLTEGWLDEKAIALGPFKETMQFMVEQPIAGHAVESGIDSYAVLGQHPRQIMWGYEKKDAGYLGTVADLPDRIRATTEAFAPALEEFEYKGPLATEIRHTEDGKDYLIDVTARYPSPPSEIQCLLIKNLAEIMYQGARGIMVQPDYAKKYGAQLVMKSDVLEGIDNRALAVKVGMSENVMLHGHCRVEDKDYVVSPAHIPEFGGAVGIGNSMAEAIEIALAAAESVKGMGVSYGDDTFDKIMETIKEGDGLGLDWGVFTGGLTYGSEAE